MCWWGYRSALAVFAPDSLFRLQLTALKEKRF
jgi:hypothetical protein